MTELLTLALQCICSITPALEGLQHQHSCVCCDAEALPVGSLTRLAYNTPKSHKGVQDGVSLSSTAAVQALGQLTGLRELVLWQDGDSSQEVTFCLQNVDDGRCISIDVGRSCQNSAAACVAAVSGCVLHFTVLLATQFRQRDRLNGSSSCLSVQNWLPGNILEAVCSLKALTCPQLGFSTQEATQRFSLLPVQLQKLHLIATEGEVLKRNYLTGMCTGPVVHCWDSMAAAWRQAVAENHMMQMNQWQARRQRASRAESLLT